MLRPYESVVLFTEATTQEDIDAVVDKIKTTATANEGSVDAVEPWGKRELAYPIEDNQRAHYVLLRLSATSQTLKEIDRAYKLEDRIIRFLTVLSEPAETQESN